MKTIIFLIITFCACIQDINAATSYADTMAYKQDLMARPAVYQNSFFQAEFETLRETYKNDITARKVALCVSKEVVAHQVTVTTEELDFILNFEDVENKMWADAYSFCESRYLYAIK